MYADVAELVDALASGASALRGVEVQVLSSVPKKIETVAVSIFLDIIQAQQITEGKMRTVKAKCKLHLSNNIQSCRK